MVADAKRVVRKLQLFVHRKRRCCPVTLRSLRIVAIAFPRRLFQRMCASRLPPSSGRLTPCSARGPVDPARASDLAEVFPRSLDVFVPMRVYDTYVVPPR